MINFDNIRNYATEFPDTWSFLGSPDEAGTISQEHQDQIFFLDKEAGEFLRNYIDSSKMMTGPVWKPFNEKYFKTVDEFTLTQNCESALKKWLYNRHIPFDKIVYIDSDRSGQSVALTWKMVIKYCNGLFFADDLFIFDETLNWGLFYFHEDKLFYGTEKIYDQEFEYEKARELNALKTKFFGKDRMNFEKTEKKQAIQNFKEKYNTDSIE